MGGDELVIDGNHSGVAHPLCRFAIAVDYSSDMTTLLYFFIALVFDDNNLDKKFLILLLHDSPLDILQRDGILTFIEQDVILEERTLLVQSRN
jgi:hypothetical protein